MIPMTSKISSRILFFVLLVLNLHNLNIVSGLSTFHSSVAKSSLVCNAANLTCNDIDFSQNDHLVVIAHGLLGFSTDLEYLSDLLREKGCTVLQSSVNEFTKSLAGVAEGGKNLADEIRKFTSTSSHFKRISFVGNSLGGLYARYAIKELYDNDTKLILGLKPYKFMTIATPHLGVRDYTFLDEYKIPIPLIIKKAISSVLKTTSDLVLSDKILKDNVEQSLLFKMATSYLYLTPLRSFDKRRLYGNLNNDFVVPLGTAAFLHDEKVQELRKLYSNKKGIIETMHSEPLKFHLQKDQESSNYLIRMISQLNSCGWEKLIVNFPGKIPIAHNKICALKKSPQFVSNLLGFYEGEYVMLNASEWLVH